MHPRHTESPFLKTGPNRLQVEFTAPSGSSLNVPGFFDGDGNGGPQGDMWRVRFTPTEPGDWTYQVSFRKGPAVAIDLNSNAGEALEPDGARGEFTVAPRDPDADGVYKWGLLEYVGTHYLKFRDGPHWIKTGLDEKTCWRTKASSIRGGVTRMRSTRRTGVMAILTGTTVAAKH
jgi:hypothetical protein